MRRLFLRLSLNETILCKTGLKEEILFINIRENLQSSFLLVFSQQMGCCMLDKLNDVIDGLNDGNIVQAGQA